MPGFCDFASLPLAGLAAAGNVVPQYTPDFCDLDMGKLQKMIRLGPKEP
jgi:hypothetical protein